MWRFALVVGFVFVSGCAGTQYQAQMSSNYLSSTNDIVITTTVVAHN